MQKISDSTATANAAGEFTEGNPAAGAAATLIKAAWLNAVQRELANVVAGGGLTLDPKDDSQLLKAIKAVQASAIQSAIAGLVDSSPAALDTLKELADALGGDPNFATTITNALAGKAAKATTRDGYGITDVYTMDQVDDSLRDKADKNTTLRSVFSRYAGFLEGDVSSPFIEHADGTVVKLQASLGYIPVASSYSEYAGFIEGAKDKPFIQHEDGTVVRLVVDRPIPALDPWTAQPVGALIALLDNSPVPIPPTDSSLYRYIRLTASDAYNTGVLTGELVVGSGATLLASAAVSLPGSPFNGVSVRLINTERRVLRAGGSGSIEQDAFQGHSFGDPRVPDTYRLATTAQNDTGIPAGRDNGLVTSRLNATDPAMVQLIFKSDGTNGAPRVAAETRVKSMGVTYYLRIK